MQELTARREPQRVGDVDVVGLTRTGVDLDWYEGPGAMWNIDWADWTKRSFSLA